MSSGPWLFIHLPKTAGTSFRHAAQSLFGKQNVLCDYGAEAKETSAVVRERMYADEGFPAVKEVLSESGACMLAGHFELERYARWLGLPNTMTVLRDPVQQVISHYRHYVRYYRHQGSFTEFYRNDDFRNVQSRLLNGWDPALLGLVGLTERFKETLALVNGRWNWRLKEKKDLVAGRFRSPRVHPDEEQIAEIRHLNAADVNCYQRAVEVLENLLFFAQREPSYDPRGGFLEAKRGEPLRGWALDMVSDQPPDIRLQINRREVAAVQRDSVVEALQGWGLPTDGQCGFSVDAQALTSGDQLELVEARHGRILAQYAVAGA